MLRYLVRSLLILSVLATLFLMPQDASRGVGGLRWAEVDQGVASYAYRAGAMMVQKDKVTSISQIYGALMFDGTRWQVDQDRMTFPRSDYMGNLFLDSRGIIYAGGVRADYNGTGTPASYIYESTDGLHFTPVQPFVDVAGGGKIWNFTEDKYGNVWAGEFTTHAATTGAHLWRRRPNGTWTNVGNWGPPEDHIHQVYYDPYRDALYVAIGDQDHGILKLPSDKINADGISAADFSFILPRFPDGTAVEVTAMTSDASYLYAGMDMHSPVQPDPGKVRAIARITDNGVAQTIEAVYPLPDCALWQWADVDDAGNIIFSSTGINEWNCTDGDYVNQIVVSSDHGSTWSVVKDFGSSATSEGLEYTGLASPYATNWSGLYGGGNGWGGASLRATIGRVIPANATFYVDETNGVDWTNFGTSAARPIKTLDYLEMLDVQPGDSVQFVGSNTYTKPLMVGWGGDSGAKVALRGNPASAFVGGNAATVPVVTETFEGAKASWNFIIDESGGAVTADAAIIHEGAQSAKVVRGAAGTVSLRLRNVVGTDIKEGDTLYLGYWVYYPADQTADSDPTMLRLLDTSYYELRMKLQPQSASNLTNEMVLNIPAWSSWQIPARRSLTSGTWHKIYIEDYLHPTDGRFKMYVDDILWYNVNGIKTVTASGGKLMDISFYNFEKPITYYIDDLRFGKAPFDARGAINTNGYDSLDLGGFGVRGTNGVMISSQTADVDVHDSIFSSLTGDAIVNQGNADVGLYYNTVYGAGRYGIYAGGNATLQNNVVYNSGASDVFTAAGATLTGSHNWFRDAGASGGGTYVDVGSTTWSGADPAFVNAGAGDFRLGPASPLIDAGTPIAGLSSDFVGATRPQGAAPDIGAYETSHAVTSSQLFLPFVSKQ